MTVTMMRFDLLCMRNSLEEPAPSGAQFKACAPCEHVGHVAGRRVRSAGQGRAKARRP